MKRFVILLLTLATFGALEAKNPPVHRVISANISITGLDADKNTIHEWDNRKHYMIDVIRSYKPDVIMMQEVIND